MYVYINYIINANLQETEGKTVPKKEQFVGSFAPGPYCKFRSTGRKIIQLLELSHKEPPPQRNATTSHYSLRKEIIYLFSGHKD